MSGAALGALLVHLETLEARVAELSRPRHPEDYGVQTLRLSPTEERILMALLPPGEVVHRDALIARVWPEIADAGLVGESAHLLRVHMSRTRGRLRTGWRIPTANTRGEYVLLAPDQPLPAGYHPFVPSPPPGLNAAGRAPCPECDGQMAEKSKRCIRCSIRLRAARAQPSRVACPDCAAWMDGRSTRCYRCDLARRQHRQGAVA
jgi:hypothetical protein